jgi:hypothetical protein
MTSPRLPVLDLEEARSALARRRRDPAAVVAQLLKEQHHRTVEFLDAYADALLARGASPVAVCAIRDAADVLAGKLSLPPVPDVAIPVRSGLPGGAERERPRRSARDLTAR